MTAAATVTGIGVPLGSSVCTNVMNGASGSGRLQAAAARSRQKPECGIRLDPLGAPGRSNSLQHDRNLAMEW
jgi:hypothetical protein